MRYNKIVSFLNESPCIIGCTSIKAVRTLLSAYSPSSLLQFLHRQLASLSNSPSPLLRLSPSNNLVSRNTLHFSSRSLDLPLRFLPLPVGFLFFLSSARIRHPHICLLNEKERKKERACGSESVAASSVERFVRNDKIPQNLPWLFRTFRFTDSRSIICTFLIF